MALGPSASISSPLLLILGAPFWVWMALVPVLSNVLGFSPAPQVTVTQGLMRKHYPLQ